MKLKQQIAYHKICYLLFIICGTRRSVESKCSVMGLDRRYSSYYFNSIG